MVKKKKKVKTHVQTQTQKTPRISVGGDYTSMDTGRGVLGDY